MKKNILFLGMFILLISIGTLVLSTTITRSLNPYNNANSNSKKDLNEIPRMAQEIAWNTNGNPVCLASEHQNPIRIISDGAGGAIITWEDERNTDTDIYAQHIDSDGNVQWGSNGIEICIATGIQEYPEICTDGTGGAIITWQDQRGTAYDIYAQHVDSGGNVQWGTNGIEICTATNSQYSPQICSDGSGGAIITWYDYRGSDIDIYAQHVDSGGNVQWGTNGIEICDEDDEQSYQTICSDGAGGAVIAWRDYRNGNYDIYAQHINHNGITQWFDNGRPVCMASYTQTGPKVISDESGGAIIAWKDYRNVNDDIYAQHVDSGGNVQWGGNGIAICTATGTQDYHKLCSDGAGGAIITWDDFRSGTDDDVYAQRVSSDGEIEWVVNGVAICTATDDQGYTDICSDGAGGAVICWNDKRSGDNDNWDTYAQQINSSGDIQWVSNGVGICILDENQGNAVLSSDGKGNIIMAWIDRRNGDDFDIYAQKITVPIPESSINGYSIYFISLSICIIVLIFTIRIKRKYK